MKLYRSPYEAYPFLADAAEDLRCDFEILTDEISSKTGLLAALCPEKREELLKLDELVYHMNPSLRTFFSITEGEVLWLNQRLEALLNENKGRCNRFVLPAGTHRACLAHVLRTDGKKLVRMLYRHAQSGGNVDNRLFDFANLVSGYFFQLALWLNAEDRFEEVPFVSRNYK